MKGAKRRGAAELQRAPLRQQGFRDERLHAYRYEPASLS
jgi:hypothetical protein